MIKRFTKGFTLVEMLIAVSVAAVAGVILISILVSGNSLFLQQNAKVFQGLSLNDASDQISNLIRQSSQVAASYPSANPQYITSSQVLVLKIPSINASGDIIDQKNDYAVITQDLTKKTILREFIFPDPVSSRKSENKVLSTNVSSIVFLYMDNNSNLVSPTSGTKINFSILLKEKAGYNDRTSSASGQVNLRNI